MKFSLLPKEEKFFELFILQAKNVRDGVEALNGLVDNYTDVEQKYRKIEHIEHTGDNITHDIFTKLRDTFITPFEREDIHELASGLDDVLDCIEGVASRLHYFSIQSPTPELKQLVVIIHEAVQQIYEAILRLKSLEHAHTFCEKINTLENQADVICQTAIAALFEKARDVEQVKELIKLKEIYSRLETASDRCEDVANVIESIIVKST
ncbi:MAG TPA: DUF47 domain-containing protein [Candidatus Kerfeldbacteria bacterium]|nr:MAG: hypothetical protein UY34_C0006G0004 [Parcubacteria group bacterium GW2011_GWA2_48_9]HCJ52175.1 DUF47 domain-containing protein [Candidatus Kerfeldbacteria bacterium]HCM67392.1 DUF47 domain-containing protein [Candidatus Kerfeldbacteria bacterium]